MATDEREFHAHRGQPVKRKGGKFCPPDDDQVTHISQYDSETTWTLDIYDERRAKQLVAQGLQPLPSTHSAGQLFAVTTRQLIAFLADSEGIAIEFRQRKKRTLTDEQKQAQSDRMKALNAARNGALI